MNGTMWGRSTWLQSNGAIWRGRLTWGRLCLSLNLRVLLAVCCSISLCLLVSSGDFVATVSVLSSVMPRYTGVSRA